MKWEILMMKRKPPLTSPKDSLYTKWVNHLQLLLAFFLILFSTWWYSHYMKSNANFPTLYWKLLWYHFPSQVWAKDFVIAFQNDEKVPGHHKFSDGKIHDLTLPWGTVFSVELDQRISGGMELGLGGRKHGDEFDSLKPPFGKYFSKSLCDFFWSVFLKRTL